MPSTYHNLGIRLSVIRALQGHDLESQQSTTRSTSGTYDSISLDLSRWRSAVTMVKPGDADPSRIGGRQTISLLVELNIQPLTFVCLYCDR